MPLERGWSKMDKMTAKKAQEEIVGFIAIVVIISIVLVIFLVIILNRDSTQIVQSKELYQFLESMLQFTSPCAIGYEPNYVELGELLEECNKGLAVCTSGEEPCSLAEKTITEILDASFLVSEEGEIKGYEFVSLYSTENKKALLNVSKGNCFGTVRGAEMPVYSSGGSISNILKICY